MVENSKSSMEPELSTMKITSLHDPQEVCAMLKFNRKKQSRKENNSFKLNELLTLVFEERQISQKVCYLRGIK
jgi:hypothetical protein